MARWLLDTNVVLRSSAPTSAAHPTATAATKKLLAAGDELLLAPQVIMEFWASGTRPTDANGYGWSAATAEARVVDLRKQFPLLPATARVFDEWLRLVCAHSVLGKPVHDARLVAWMNTHGVRNLLTFNVGDFKRYSILAVSPKDV